jgi:hypothetical protein
MHLLHDDEILPRVTLLGFIASEHIRTDLLDDAHCGPALRAYLALTDGRVGTELAPQDRLYNRYYWFFRLVNIYRDKFGYDAGIEQQADRILEYADCDFEVADIKQLEAAARAAH